jgi:hypothetical protein
LIATFALLAWPAVALVLYRLLPLGLATLWTILGGQLLLPAGTEAVMKIPMIPQFDKASIPNLCALIGCVVAARRLPRILPAIGVPEVLITACLLGGFITSELNGDDVVFAHFVLPGVGLYDAVSTAEASFVSLIPFFLGRQFLRGSSDILAILEISVVAGLIYSIPMWFEIRFSPQLHYWLYGYYSSNFIQEMRADGGFRPMVFMGHGLAAAFFIMSSTVAAAALWRTRVRVFHRSSAVATVYLGVLLVMCKSFGALLYALVLVPLVRFVKPMLQLRIASLLVIVAIAYPMLRSYDLVPTQFILDSVSKIDESRSASLGTRFQFEDILLKRASERILFGWGRYGRSRLYTDYGDDYILADGYWVITLGQFGVFGFLAQFGLLSICVLRSVAACKLLKSMSEKVHLAALSLILAVNVLDLIPNSGLIPWTWLVAGALLGRSEAILARKSQKAFVPETRSANLQKIGSSI